MVWTPPPCPQPPFKATQDAPPRLPPQCSRPPGSSTLRAPGKRTSRFPTHRHSHSHLCSGPHQLAPGMPLTASTLRLGFQLLSPLYTDLFTLLWSSCMRSLDSSSHATHSHVPSPQSRLACAGHTVNGQVLPPCFLGGSPHTPSFWPADGAPQVRQSQTSVALACLASIARSLSHSSLVFFGTPQFPTPWCITQA